MTAVTGGDLEVTVRGGDLLTVTSLRHRGEELLVAADAIPAHHLVHERGAGITLLHPWANRLGADAYEAAGVAARVPAGDPAIARDTHGLAIHGLAVPGAWTVTSGRTSEAEWAEATGDFGAHPAFPFPHRITVVFEVHDGGLRITTELRPTAGVPVPVAFGWHPYLRVPGVPRHSWRVSLPKRRHLDVDDRGIPLGAARDEPAEAVALAGRAWDDGFADLPPGSVFAVAGGGRELRVILEAGYPAAQVFAPPDEDVIALEPMTAVTDALRTGRGLRCAAPGSTDRAVFRVEVVPPGPR